MTTTFFLLRHAAHDNVGGFLAGRSEGIRLGEAGRAQARRLAQTLKHEAFAAILTSPRERTRETAQAVADACGGPEPEVAAELDEVDFGSWSGQTFDVLNHDPQWRRWNKVRSLTRTPAGEDMLDVQRRVTRLMARVRDRYADARVALVSHADVIKAAVSHVLGLPIDAWPRFDVSPASITTLVTGDWGAKLVTLNAITE